MLKQFVLLEVGRHRAVYRHGDYVVKVPLDRGGIDDNHFEAWKYKRSLEEEMYCKYARCRLLGSLLVMEFAAYPGPWSEPSGIEGCYKIPYNHLPEWAFSIDCFQVGYNKNGEIVAYDYGL